MQNMIHASFTDWNGNELQHYGTRGMKWGERRFQNEDGSLTALGRERYGVHGERSALGTKHDLNKLNREQATAKARADYYTSKTTKRVAKASLKMKKAEAAGNTEKAAKYQAKIDQTKAGIGQKAVAYQKKLEASKKMTDKIISNAISKGYSIQTRDCIRRVNRGRGIATRIATLGIIKNQQHAVGLHYRVKNNGLGIQTHRSRRWNFGQY